MASRWHSRLALCVYGSRGGGKGGRTLHFGWHAQCVPATRIRDSLDQATRGAQNAVPMEERCHTCAGDGMYRASGGFCQRAEPAPPHNRPSSCVWHNYRKPCAVCGSRTLRRKRIARPRGWHGVIVLMAGRLTRAFRQRDVGCMAHARDDDVVKTRMRVAHRNAMPTRIS